MTSDVANTQRNVSAKFDSSKELMNKIESEYNRVDWQSEASESFKARFEKLKNDRALIVYKIRSSSAVDFRHVFETAVEEISVL